MTRQAPGYPAKAPRHDLATVFLRLIDGVTTKRQKPRIRSGGRGPNTRLSSGNIPSPFRITPRSTVATTRLMTGMPDGLSTLHKAGS